MFKPPGVLSALDIIDLHGSSLISNMDASLSTPVFTQEDFILNTFTRDPNVFRLEMLMNRFL